MPVDFLQLLPQAKMLGEAEFSRQKRNRELLVIALQKLHQAAQEPSGWIQKIESRLAQGRSLPRIALPSSEAPDAAINAHAADDSSLPILAADGSQITPDRHEALYMALINIAIITLHPGSRHAPVESVTTRLEISESDESEMTEALLALQRDTDERVLLAEASSTLPGCIALTDGPLELFHQPQQAQAFERMFTAYLSALKDMQSSGAIPAGYVDKPRSSLVTRMLDLGDENPGSDLCRLDDASLFAALLDNRQRSAVFRMFSEPGKRYSEELSLHCFFLNVATQGKPWIARVEIPAWVAKDPQAVSHLHTALLEQCRLSGNRPYPYLLHRAHETALVSWQEKEEIMRMACTFVLTQGGSLEEISHKQSMKNLTGRTRHTL